MILVCGGMMRSGSVWMNQMLRELLSLTNTGSAPNLPLNHEFEFIDRNLDNWAELPFYKLIKLHEWRDSMASVKDHMRVVMTYRDLRDTALSLMAFWQNSFEEILASKILLRIRDAEFRWMEELDGTDNLYALPYEDLKKWSLVEFLSAARWVTTKANTTICQQILCNWSIEENKKRAARNLAPSDPEYMAQRHIVSGEIARWHKELMPEQAQQVIDQVGLFWFEMHGYELE